MVTIYVCAVLHTYTAIIAKMILVQVIAVAKTSSAKVAEMVFVGFDWALAHSFSAHVTEMIGIGINTIVQYALTHVAFMIRIYIVAFAGVVTLRLVCVVFVITARKQSE